MSTAQTIKRLGISLDPLDVLFFRDGRPFGAGSRVGSGLPPPQTVAGAIWTALLERHGRQFNRLLEARDRPRDIPELLAKADAPSWLSEVTVRGPWLAQLDSAGNPK